MRPAFERRSIASFSRLLVVGAALPILLSLPVPAQVVLPRLAGELPPPRTRMAAQLVVETQIVVETQNLAGVSEGTLAVARERARAVLAEAGVASVWRGMERAQAVAVPGRRRMIVRLATARNAFSANERCLGEALVEGGGGTLAVVYVDRVRRFAQRYQLPLGLALAYAAVHEVGHLLEGNTSHAGEGVMQAHWDAADALAMRTGKLRFTEGVADRLRAGAGGEAMVAVHEVAVQVVPLPDMAAQDLAVQGARRATPVIR